LSEGQKAMLDEREKEYKQGKGKNFTWQEAKKMIRGKKDAA
jgi:phosphoribosylanthranilate isomerase